MFDTKRIGMATGGLLLTALAVTAFGISDKLMQLPVSNDWLLDTTRDAGFVLNDLEISGMYRTSEQDILAQLDVDNGMPIMAVNLEIIREKLEALPWVDVAHVARKFPGTLNIQLSEREPYALWQVNEKVHLIDKMGSIIEGQNLVEYAPLMLMVGKGAIHYIDSLDALVSDAPDVGQNIRQAIRVGERRWDLIFKGGVRVKLPADHADNYDSEKAWQRFIRLERQYNLLAREVSVIDMRIPGQLLMRVSKEGEERMKGKQWAI